jgi:hypothetical protein
MRAVSWIEQIVGTAALLFIPILWPDRLALVKVWPYIAVGSSGSWTINWALIAFALSSSVLVHGQWAGERAAAKEQKIVGEDRALMEAYAAAVKDSIRSAAVAHNMKPSDRLVAQKKILSTIANVVYLYYSKEDELEINACLMLVYAVADVPAEIADRVKQFIEKGRLLNTYAHVLDLSVWAKDCQPSHLSLPVEDPTDADMKLKLLPGAPAAFALRVVQTIESTDDLISYFGPRGAGRNLDGVAKEAQLKFFGQQGFKSFVSIPIVIDEKILGILNVQSNKVCILGRRNKNLKPVTDLLEPLWHALGWIAATSPQTNAS